MYRNQIFLKTMNEEVEAKVKKKETMDKMSLIVDINCIFEYFSFIESLPYQGSLIITAAPTYVNYLHLFHLYSECNLYKNTPHHGRLIPCGV